MENNITLELLKKRQKELKEEIKKMDSNIKIKKQELKVVTETITTLTKSKSVSFKAEIEIPKQYSNELRWEDKVVYILNKKKEATVQELNSEVLKRDKEGDLNPQAIYPIIQQIITRMLRGNKLIKIGHYKSKYKLNI